VLSTDADEEKQRRKLFNYHGRRTSLVNHVAAAMLNYVDVVIYVDADEFLIPHPRTGLDLRGYLEQLDQRVVAGVGLNLIHQPSIEASFDDDRGFLEQRRHVAFVPRMCKPNVKQAPIPWTAGFHGCQKRYRVDPNLLLVHTKFYDVEAALSAHQSRRGRFNAGAGSRHSTWALSPDEMAAELTRWTRLPRGGTPELDVDTLTLDVVRKRRAAGGFQSAGSQVKGMRASKVYHLPDGLRTQF
jgi:hypothetical protein